MSTAENQAPAGLVAGEPYVSAHGRALVVVALFVVYIAVTLCAIASTVFILATEPVVLAAGDGAEEEITLNHLLRLLSGLSTFAVYVVLVVAFLVWLHRVSRNLPALGNPKSGVEYSPGWAVGSFFVPFVNLVVPYRAVREVWEKSDPDASAEDGFMFAQPSSAPLLLGWWVTWIVSNVVSNISWRLHADAETLDVPPFVSSVEIVADALGIVSAVLAVLVVRGIDRRQEERARHITYVPHMPPPPPLFTPPQGA